MVEKIRGVDAQKVAFVLAALLGYRWNGGYRETLRFPFNDQIKSMFGPEVEKVASILIEEAEKKIRVASREGKEYYESALWAEYQSVEATSQDPPDVNLEYSSTLFDVQLAFGDLLRYMDERKPLEPIERRPNR